MTDYICETCNKKFCNKQSLKYHIDNNACKLIESKTEYNCPCCETVLRTKISFEKHIQSKKHSEKRLNVMEDLDNKIEEELHKYFKCKKCGGKITQITKGRKKLFCEKCL